MSFKIIGKAFDIPLKGNDKLVFLSLCEYANDDDNTCYPSMTTLMKKATISRGALAYCLNVLENLGFIKRTQQYRKNGSKSSTLYTVFVDTELNQELYKNRQSLIKKGSPDNGLGDSSDNGLPSSDNGLPKGGLSSDNGLLEPLVISFNPLDNPKNIKKDFKVFKEETLLKFKELKISTFKDKITSTPETLQAFSELQADNKHDVINLYANHVRDKKGFAKRLDRWLLAYNEGSLHLLEDNKKENLLTDLDKIDYSSCEEAF